MCSLLHLFSTQVFHCQGPVYQYMCRQWRRVSHYSYCTEYCLLTLLIDSVMLNHIVCFNSNTMTSLLAVSFFYGGISYCSVKLLPVLIHSALFFKDCVFYIRMTHWSPPCSGFSGVTANFYPWVVSWLSGQTEGEKRDKVQQQVSITDRVIAHKVSTVLIHESLKKV